MPVVKELEGLNGSGAEDNTAKLRTESATDGIYSSVDAFNSYIEAMLPQAIENRIHSRLINSTKLYSDRGGVKEAVEKIENEVLDYPRRGKAKLLRSKIMWLVGKMYGAKEEDLLLPAIAIELSQNSILIMDDIEDDESVRRGDAPLHVKYGLGHAINASNYLNKEVWATINDYAGTAGNKVANRLYDILQNYADSTYVGQKMELEFWDLNKLDEDMCEMIIRNKTAGYSAAAPVEIGAAIAKVNDKVAGKLSRIGMAIGTAFQIRDDIADIEEDVSRGTPTFLIYHTYSKASAEEKMRLRKIYAEVNKSRIDMDKERMHLSDHEKEYIADMLRRHNSMAPHPKNSDKNYIENLTDKLAAKAHISEDNKKYVMGLMKKYKSEEYAVKKKGEYMQEAVDLYMECMSDGTIPDDNYSSLIIEIFGSYVYGG